jgi:hypothetical protein
MITLAPRTVLEEGTITYILQSRRPATDWSHAGNLGTDAEHAQSELTARRAMVAGLESDVEYRVTGTLVEVLSW